MTLSFAPTTARLDLPLMAPAQAAKHIIHNEALAQIDQLLGASLISDALASPPETPETGDSYVVPDGSSWDEAANTIVTWNGTAWDATTPMTGLLAYVTDRDAVIVYTGSEWRTVGGLNDLSQVGINSSADTNNRLSVASPASLFNHDGDSHRLKINKAADTDTASVVFQSGFSGRAEFGLLGDTQFGLKVSADGQTFKDALRIDGDGHVEFPTGLNTDMRVGRVSSAGGETRIIGPMSVSTLPLGRETLSLDAGRIYFSAFYVDRPSRLHAAHIARTKASTAPGALIRCGLFQIGSPFGNSWQVGERILDYGTCDATQAGHHTFDLGGGVLLTRGWYLHAIGADADGVSVRALQWLSPGTSHYVTSGSGTSADFRLSGIARLVLSGDETSAITQGFPQSWNGNFTDVVTIEPHIMQPLLPEWEPE